MSIHRRIMLVGMMFALAAVGMLTAPALAQGPGEGRPPPGQPGCGERPADPTANNIATELDLLGVEVMASGLLSPQTGGYQLAQEAPPRPEGDRAGGRVTAVEGTTISVENRDGESETIYTDADTEFRRGRRPAELGDIHEGDIVIAFGELQQDGLHASLVFIKQPGPPPGPGPRPGRPPRLRGVVTEVNAPAFTVETCRGHDVTVTTDENTVYRSRPDDEVSFEDIEVDTRVIVAGRPVEDQEHTLLAKIVVILPPPN